MHTIFLTAVLSLLVAGAPTADDLIARHAKEDAPVWCDGDVATFFYQGDADKVQVSFGGQMLALHRLANSDVWTRTVHRNDMAKAVFSYAIVPAQQSSADARGRVIASVFRGPKARPAPEFANPLQGTTRVENFDSQALGGERRVHVYLPPGHDRAQRYRVIYGTDGKLNAGILEPLIVSGKIPPVIVIASEAAHAQNPAPRPRTLTPTNFLDNDPRGQEYVPGFNDARFKPHEKFFCRELLPWAEREFGASRSPADRAVMGCSFGAHFALEMGVRHPELFGHVFAFSCAGFWMTSMPRFNPPPGVLGLGVVSGRASRR